MPVRLHLTLYVAGGDTPRSLLAKRRLDALVKHLGVAEVLAQVVDVLDAPDVAEAARIFATPALVRELPLPGRRVIGDLANVVAVAAALGVSTMADGGDR